MFRTTFFVVLFGITIFSSTSAYESINDKVIKLLVKLKDDMKVGDPEKGIPPLDPLAIRNITIGGKHEPGSLSRVKANFTNMEVTGLSSYAIDDVKVSILSLDIHLNLSFPELKLQGLYGMDGVFVVFPVYGKGPFFVSNKNVHISGKATLHMMPNKTLEVEKLALKADAGTVELDLKNFLGGGDLAKQLHAFVQDVGKKLAKNVVPKLVEALSDFAKMKLNDMLRTVDISQIIG